MEINCEAVVEKYLLNQNPLYAFSFPISILVAIIFFGIAKAYEWSNNSYINQILIPIVALLLTMVIIDVVSRLMIKKHEKDNLTNLCKLWMHDPSVKNNPLLNKMINMDLVKNYKVENFSSGNFSIQDNDFHNNIPENEEKNNSPNMRVPTESKIPNHVLEDPIATIPNIYPAPLEFAPNNSQCIQGSNCCSLCSGSGENPCNLNAPIPGPQWLPQSAAYVQNRLKNNDYTQSKCSPKL